MKCNFLTIYYTLRYPKEGLFNGWYLSGHDYKYTGEIHNDHWEMECFNCGSTAASEIGPNAKIEELK